MNDLSCMDRLMAALCRLPGIGRRSAERMALALARDPRGLLQDLAQALQDVGKEACTCVRCGGLTHVAVNPCRLCTDPRRDAAALCVVEDANDILPLEKSSGFRGRYHTLGGRLSPMGGQGPADLRIAALIERVRAEGVKEVILALNTDVESDATASYISERLRGLNVRVTRLAYGLPAGSGIAYSDPITLARAIKGRQEM